MKVSIYDYIAISIDFEGWISLAKSYSKYGVVNYHSIIEISNTNKELLEHFKTKTKIGIINGPYKKDGNRKDIFKLHFRINEIREHLPKILPFLIDKEKQAELVIEALFILKDLKFITKLSPQEKSEMYTDNEMYTLEAIYRECYLLNERGKKK